MAPTEAREPETGGLGQARLQEIITRLKEVRRRCANDPLAAGRRNAAVEGLADVLADLEARLESASEPTRVEYLNLRLATVERRFEAMGSRGVALVVASIRSSLAALPEDPSPEEEPPPPRRFQPSPTSAVRRRRPRPKTRQRPAEAPAATRKGRFGWLRMTILIAGAIAVAAVGYFRWIEPRIATATQPERGVIEQPVLSTSSTSAGPVPAPARSGPDQESDAHEEDMARFTFEMSLAESSLQEGDLHRSLRHFAAAAAIDRRNRRVAGMGKSLIAAILHQADVAWENGDRDLAGKRVLDARSIARGLQLVGSTADGPAAQSENAARFEDISEPAGESLQPAVGHVVRLTLKTSDVIFGYLIKIDDDILVLDAYSGAKGPGIDSAVAILASTIKEVRVYDAA